MRKPQEPELELGIGAASYLKFLEINVARAQKRLDESHAALDQCLLNQRDKPDELDGEDYEVSTARARAECKDAQESMLRLGKQLLEFDKNVDTNRRDVSESITKDEATKFFFAFAICIRGGVEQAATRQAQDAMEVKSPEDMYKLTAPLLRECLASALASAVKECQIPPWVASTIEGAL